MKLVVAIVHTKNANDCADSLTRSGFVCTRVNSFGGFLEKDNVTLLVCVDDPRVDDAIAAIRSKARPRHEALESSVPMAAVGGGRRSSPGLDVEVGGATVFVVPVERFERL